jgi:hypothetical protein
LQVFTTVVTKLLEPLLTLRSLILTQTSEDDAVRSQIKRHIEDIVLHSLFHPDHLFEYSLAFSLKQNVVTPASSGKPPRSNGNIVTLSSPVHGRGRGYDQLRAARPRNREGERIGSREAPMWER